MLAGCSASLFLGLVATASSAAADPGDPVVPPGPVVVAPAPAAAVPVPPAAETVQSADTDAALLPAPAPEPAVSVPPNGVPHLASPDSLPPGSTMQAPDNDSPNVSYLKDLWQAVQNHEISGKEALIMGFAQRGMDTPYPNQAPGPNVPLTPADQAPAPLAPPPAAPLPPPPPGAPLPAAPLPPTP